MASFQPTAHVHSRVPTMSGGKPDVSHAHDLVDCAVVIVTYNSEDDIVGLLDSLPNAAAGLTLRIIVVDNGSTDATIKLVRGYRDVICVETGANLGYSGGINVGRELAAGYSALLVLNADVVLETGAIREMFVALEDPAIGIVAPMVLRPDGRCFQSLYREPTVTRGLGDCLLGRRFDRPAWLSQFVRDDHDYRYQHSIDWATGAALMVSSVCDRAVGAWDERFFLYSEEVDYAARARSAGFRVEFVPSAKVRHRERGSGESDDLNALIEVNRIRYMEKWGHWPRTYRWVVVLSYMLRAWRRDDRNRLKILLRRSRWPAVLVSLGVPDVSHSLARSARGEDHEDRGIQVP